MLAVHLVVEHCGFDAFLTQVMLISFVVAFNFFAGRFVCFARGT